MDCCRPDWTPEFRDWLIDMVIFSFKSAVVCFRGLWYGVVDGVPTGGVPSVDVANMSVFFVLKQLIYNHPNSNLHRFIRFVDDGCGIWKGDEESFFVWFENLRSTSVTTYGLDLTLSVKPVTEFTQFLDIQFKFYNGILTTDIFRKPTDANRYLSFSSFHPKHTFKSVVFSQGMRYRRVINNNSVLQERLNELKTFFVGSGYPQTMVESILDPIPAKPRQLVQVHESTESPKQFITPWVVTYGPAYDETKTAAVEVNDLLSRSDTWKNTSTRVIQVVPRRARNLKDILYRRKALALGGQTPDSTLSCNAARCQTCRLVSNNEKLYHNGTHYKTLGGTCKSWNVVYCFQCKICNIMYVGKTTDPLHVRANGHRSKFYEVLKNSSSFQPGNIVTLADYDDEQILGAHIVHDHRVTERNDFNCNYRLFVLCQPQPNNLRISEQFWINKLKTYRPYGLNQNSAIE